MKKTYIVKANSYKDAIKKIKDNDLSNEINDIDYDRLRSAQSFVLKAHKDLKLAIDDMEDVVEPIDSTRTKVKKLSNSLVDLWKEIGELLGDKF